MFVLNVEFFSLIPPTWILVPRRGSDNNRVESSQNSLSRGLPPSPLPGFNVSSNQHHNSSNSPNYTPPIQNGLNFNPYANFVPFEPALASNSPNHFSSHSQVLHQKHLIFSCVFLWKVILFWHSLIILFLLWILRSQTSCLPLTERNKKLITKNRKNPVTLFFHSKVFLFVYWLLWVDKTVSSLYYAPHNHTVMFWRYLFAFVCVVSVAFVCGQGTWTLKEVPDDTSREWLEKHYYPIIMSQRTIILSIH